MKSIFVSSTFKDFQTERDCLRRIVQPELNRVAGEYGESVSFCDLRWGIDTAGTSEEESSSKVLSVCLNEIDRSRPYMIVLLGERYGYMPGAGKIGREARRHGLDLEDMEISVTQLEIEYGALQKSGDAKRVFFYVRQISGDDIPQVYRSEGEAERKRLEALTERIRRFAGNHVRSYTAGWDGTKLTGLDTGFCRMVADDLKGMLREEWDAFRDLSPEEKDELSQNNYLEEKRRPFRARKALADELTERLSSNKRSKKSMLAIQGASGTGKSILFAEVCHRVREQGWNVLAFMGGSTGLSTRPEYIRSRIIAHMEELTGWVREEEQESEVRAEEIQKDFWEEKEEQERRYLLELAEECAARKIHVIAAVDAVDQLDPGELRDLLTFLPTGDGRYVRLLVTGTEEIAFPSYADVVELGPLDEDEIREAAEGIFASMGKQLPGQVLSELSGRPEASNPLYLFMAATLLGLLDEEDFAAIREQGGGAETIDAFLQEKVRDFPKSLPELSVLLCSTAASHVGAPQMLRAAEYTAVSRFGLREEQLEAVLEKEGLPFTPLSLAMFLNYMQELFIRREDGRYDFLHKCIREGFLESLHGHAGEDAPSDELKHMNAALAETFSVFPVDAPERAEEYIWHTVQADQGQKLIRSVSTTPPGTAVGEAVAVVLRQVIAEDGGTWFTAQMKQYGPKLGEDGLYHLVRFIYHRLRFYSGSEECMAVRAVMEENARLADLLCSRKKNATYEWERAAVYIGLGQTFDYVDSSEDLQRALELYKKAAAAIRKLRSKKLPKKDKADLHTQLLDLYAMIAGVYSSLGGDVNWDQMFQYGKQGVLLFEEKYGKLTYDGTPMPQGQKFPAPDYHALRFAAENLHFCARACFYRKDDEEAEKYVLAELSVREMAGNIRPEAKTDTKMQECRELLWIIREKSETDESAETAARRKEVERLERVFKEKPDTGNKRKLGKALRSLANILEKGDKKDIEEGLSVIDRAYAIAKEIMDELNEPEYVKEIVECAVQYEKMLRTTKEKKNQAKAADVCLESIGYLKKVLEHADIKAIDTVVSWRQFSILSFDAARVYILKKSCLEQAIDLSLQAVRADEMLVREQNAAEDKKRLAHHTMALGTALIMRGRGDDAEKALEYTERSIEMWHQFLAGKTRPDDAPTAELYADTYSLLAEILFIQGGEENIRKAEDAMRIACKILLTDEKSTAIQIAADAKRLFSVCVRGFRGKRITAWKGRYIVRYLWGGSGDE